MAGPRERASEFDSILNFRDVAVSVNQYERREVLRPGRLYRSARPDTASISDRNTLTQRYGLKTIVDLRSKTEHIEAAKQASRSTQTHPENRTAPFKAGNNSPTKIPGIDYAEINLNGKGFERHLVWQLSYINLIWLAIYMLLGYRLEGISIISKNVLQPRGLIGLGQDTLRHSGPEIKAVFDVLADARSYPVLVHCTQGKDRTGLIVVLVLLLCGLDVATIAQDYTMSEKELEDEFEERMKEIRSIGLDETFARCPETFVAETNDFIVSRYVSVERYLNSIGISSEQIDQVRVLLRR